MANPPARTRKYRVLRVALWTGNRTLAWGLRHRLSPAAFALLETTGRRTGRLRHTVIGNGLEGLACGMRDDDPVARSHRPPLTAIV